MFSYVKKKTYRLSWDVLFFSHDCIWLHPDHFQLTRSAGFVQQIQMLDFSVRREMQRNLLHSGLIFHIQIAHSSYVLFFSLVYFTGCPESLQTQGKKKTFFYQYVYFSHFCFFLFLFFFTQLLNILRMVMAASTRYYKIGMDLNRKHSNH